MGVRRRNTELGLLLMAVVVIGAAYTLASFAAEKQFPAHIGPFLLVVLGMLLAAHLVVRRLAPTADPILLPVAALLNGIGYVVITTTPNPIKPHLPEHLAGLQAAWTGVGIFAFVATLVVIRHTRVLERYRYTFALLGLGLLLLPLIPHVGRSVNGSKIWVSVGPIGFQPGEIAKIVLAIFFAGYLVEKRELLSMRTFRLGPFNLPEPKHLGPVLVAWGLSIMIMVAQNDLGSSLMFFTLFVVMLWVATSRTSYLAVGGLLFGLASFLSWREIGHVKERVSIWLNPWQDPVNHGYQPIKAAFAMANGGLVGTGLGLGNQDSIPYIQTDFIFAAIAQQMGLFGATLVIVAFMLIVGSGLRIAARADAAFDKLLAVGLTTLIGIQAFLIISGVIRLLPLTGLALPFVSYGGSSLVSSWILVALLLRISDESNQRVLARTSAAVAV
jgi:cell division protein FtsW (lipid II flippase)